MAVSDLIAKANSVPAGSCATCYALATLPPDKAKILLELLSSETIKYSELADEITNDPDWPLEIDRQPLSRHARGTCSAKTKLRGGSK
jgi:hypothetical protein